MRRLDELSPRRREVVALVCEGLRNEEIAERLGISVSTVKSHLQGVFNVLGVSSRSAVQAFVQRDSRK